MNSLSPKELIQLKRFISSKIFNQNDQLVLLFDHIRKQLLGRKQDFTKPLAFRVVFGKKEYDNKEMLHLMSNLFKLCERFLTYVELYQDNRLQSLALCKSYRKRNIPKLLTPSLKKTAAQIHQTPKRNIDYHESIFELEQEVYVSLLTKKRSTDTNLQEVSNQLDIVYFAKKLRQCCTMLAQQNVYNTSFDYSIADQVIKEVEQKQLYSIPAIGIYYYAFKAQQDTENIDYFKQLQQQLVTHSALFEPTELGQIYLMAINTGIKWLNKGELKLMKELLELYKSGITSRVLLFNDQLSRFTYKNTLTLAIRLKEYEWADLFIHDYKELLPEGYREETFSYSLAHLRYAQKKYNEALNSLIITAISDDVYVNLDTKALLIRIYYEQKEFDALEAQVESFKTFIRRKKMIGYQRAHYQNFIYAVNKLIRLNSFDKSAKAKLRQEITDLEPLLVKYWFLEQV